MSDIEPATPRGNITKKAAAKSASGRSASRSAATGHFMTSKSASRKSASSAIVGAKSKPAKREKVIIERIVETREFDKPRRKRSREDNEKLVAAAKALVLELREDQKSLPNGI